MSRKILIVEDEREIAQLLQLHLNDAGCEVTLAHDGQTGLEQALAHAFDLIILD